MEEQVEAGLAKTIGLSNFNSEQITRILDNADVRPVSVQVEAHAYFQQKELSQFCKDNDLKITAYSPLGSPGLGKFMARFGQK